VWRPSQFNLWMRRPDRSLLIYNSLSGAFVQVDAREADNVASILDGRATSDPRGILSVLAVQGLLVPNTVDEFDKVRRLARSLFQQHDRLHLTLMPTEKCNFRCVYCYEDFSRGRMSAEVAHSIVSYVRHQAANLRSLTVTWFGGEPLTAFDLVEEVSHQLLEICRANRVQYSANMTTNGYLLNKQLLQRCFLAKISWFQITLDGPARIHDTLRVLAGGGGTFDTILANLRDMRDEQGEFHVRIRVNFSAATMRYVPEFLKFMGSEFGGDPRYSIYFRAVGNWGGKRDRPVEICDQATADDHEIRFMSLALHEGFGLEAWKQSMQPFGSVCYAADPRSFVIGSDGTIYKCTVAFDDPRNQVGTVACDGSLEIDEELLALWTLSEEEPDETCRLCAFRPACLGRVCPLSRLNSGERQCPMVKAHASRCLPLLASEAMAL
jgi:uncharacterized protein